MHRLIDILSPKNNRPIGVLQRGVLELFSMGRLGFLLGLFLIVPAWADVSFKTFQDTAYSFVVTLQEEHVSLTDDHEWTEAESLRAFDQWIELLDGEHVYFSNADLQSFRNRFGKDLIQRLLAKDVEFVSIVEANLFSHAVAAMKDVPQDSPQYRKNMNIIQRNLEQQMTSVLCAVGLSLDPHTEYLPLGFGKIFTDKMYAHRPESATSMNAIAYHPSLKLYELPQTGKTIALLRVPVINDGVTFRVRALYDAMIARRGSPPDGIVLDLRSNAGGRIVEAVGVAGLFSLRSLRLFSITLVGSLDRFFKVVTRLSGLIYLWRSLSIMEPLRARR